MTTLDWIFDQLPRASSASDVIKTIDQSTTEPLRVACVGGGQLGRMMALEAPRLHIQMSFLDPDGHTSPAAQVVPSDRVVQGSLQDAVAIHLLASKVDVVTVEIEHVNVRALQELEDRGVNVQPSAGVLTIIADKYLQKQHFANHGIALPPFCETPSLESIQQATIHLGLPLMLKTRRGGYDGRGNAVLTSSDSSAILEALAKLGIQDAAAQSQLDVYAEGWMNFDCEVAVMVVRSSRAECASPNPAFSTRSYPTVNAIQQDSICRLVLVPARHVSTSARHEAERLAMTAIDSLGSGASGVFGVEMFVCGSKVYLNEVAPRPHNTGHYTQNACAISQFEHHLRAITGLPLGPTNLLVAQAAMVNVLGSETLEETIQSSVAALQMAGTSVHWYGKASSRTGRKMGHINVVADSVGEVDERLSKLMALEKVPVSLMPGGSLFINSALVGVIMGSSSDLPTMRDAVDILKQFNVLYEVDIVSAHRTPEKLMSYSRNAASRGLQVIIAGAGGAAHLPGMVASMTPLPVIGVPVKTSTLSGVDSLYSIVQMPRGVPVATVAIGNATNAGLLAVRILAATRPALQERMVAYQTKMSDAVLATSAVLHEMGSDAYYDQMTNKQASVNI